MSKGPGGGPSPGEDDEATFADVLNAFTLDSRRSRKKRKRSAEDREPEHDAGPSTYGGEPVYPGEQAYPDDSGYYPSESGYGQYADEPYPPTEEAGAAPAPSPATGPPGFFEPAQGPGLFEPAVSNSGAAEHEYEYEYDYDYDYEGYAQPAEEAAVVRPYALTGGRTRANLQLELETLVSTSEAAAAQGDQLAVQFEHRAIMEECRTPRSVAEIAALLRVPLGVARVLISDAAGAGLISVHETVSGNDDAEAHLMLMERVLSGLRRL